MSLAPIESYLRPFNTGTARKQLGEYEPYYNYVKDNLSNFGGVGQEVKSALNIGESLYSGYLDWNSPNFRMGAGNTKEKEERQQLIVEELD